MGKEMWASKHPSGVNLGRKRAEGDVVGIRWKNDGGFAGLVEQEETPAPGKDNQGLAVPRAAEEMVEQGLGLHHPAQDPVSEEMPGAAALLLLLLFLIPQPATGTRGHPGVLGRGEAAQ